MVFYSVYDDLKYIIRFLSFLLLGLCAVNAGHDNVGGTRGLGNVASVADVLGRSVVCGRRGAG